MFKKLIRTDNDIAPLVLRVILGIVFYFHGMQKLTTMFGGYGFTGPWDFYRKARDPCDLRVPGDHGRGRRLAGLISGLLTRVAALASR